MGIAELIAAGVSALKTGELLLDVAAELAKNEGLSPEEFAQQRAQQEQERSASVEAIRAELLARLGGKK